MGNGVGRIKGRIRGVERVGSNGGGEDKGGGKGRE